MLVAVYTEISKVKWSTLEESVAAHWHFYWRHAPGIKVKPRIGLMP